MLSACVSSRFQSSLIILVNLIIRSVIIFYHIDIKYNMTPNTIVSVVPAGVVKFTLYNSLSYMHFKASMYIELCFIVHFGFDLDSQGF